MSADDRLARCSIAFDALGTGQKVFVSLPQGPPAAVRARLAMTALSSEPELRGSAAVVSTNISTIHFFRSGPGNSGPSLMNPGGYPDPLASGRRSPVRTGSPWSAGRETVIRRFPECAPPSSTVWPWFCETVAVAGEPSRRGAREQLIGPARNDDPARDTCPRLPEHQGFPECRSGLRPCVPDRAGTIAFPDQGDRWETGGKGFNIPWHKSALVAVGIRHQ